MSGAKVNIRPRFDFDSYAPVQGIVVDEEKEQRVTSAFHWAIINVAAIGVSLAGFCIIGWWIHGGFYLATALVGKYIPAIYILAKYGLMG